eukprot:m.29657 g.29657  ORF g.29657 m.29657 type:complete len:321 (+) comp9190_c2_seq1:264-1226(+)
MQDGGKDALRVPPTKQRGVRVVDATPTNVVPQPSCFPAKPMKSLAIDMLQQEEVNPIETQYEVDEMGQPSRILDISGQAMDLSSSSPLARDGLRIPPLSPVGADYVISPPQFGSPIALKTRVSPRTTAASGGGTVLFAETSRPEQKAHQPSSTTVLSVPSSSQPTSAPSLSVADEGRPQRKIDEAATQATAVKNAAEESEPMLKPSDTIQTHLQAPPKPVVSLDLDPVSAEPQQAAPMPQRRSSRASSMSKPSVPNTSTLNEEDKPSAVQAWLANEGFSGVAHHFKDANGFKLLRMSRIEMKVRVGEEWARKLYLALHGV